MNDQLLPKNSIDHSIPFLHWWPRKGTTEWVQYDLGRRQKATAVAVYWFDDTGHGSCRVPKSWRVLYQDGERWLPVKGASGYGVKLNGYNRVTFQPVMTTGLRLEAQLQPGFSGGILEWQVE